MFPSLQRHLAALYWWQTSSARIFGKSWQQGRNGDRQEEEKLCQRPAIHTPVARQFPGSGTIADLKDASICSAASVHVFDRSPSQ